MRPKDPKELLAYLRPGRTNSRSEMADFRVRAERVDFRSKRADFKPEKADFRSKRPDGGSNGRMEGWTNKIPLVFYRTSFPSGPLPKNRLGPNSK